VHQSFTVTPWSSLVHDLRVSLGIRLTETDRFGSLVFTEIWLSEKQGPIGYSENLEPSKFGFGSFGSVPIITEKAKYISAQRKKRKKGEKEKMDVVRGTVVAPATSSSGAASGHGHADSCCCWTMEDRAIVVGSYHRYRTLDGCAIAGPWKDALPLSDLGRTLCLC